MSYDEADVQWNILFVCAFAVVAILLLFLLPFMPFKTWSAFAAVGFGTFEAIGVRRHRDRLPPLTYIARRYLPRWLTFVIIGAGVGVAGGYWFGFAHPLALGALFGLHGWLLNHFDVTYD